MTTPTDQASRRRLRDALRERRAQLDADARAEAARRVAALLAEQPFVREARHVAGYHAVGGEMDPAPTMAACARHGASLYLPVLDDERPRHLRFRAWSEDTPMNSNRLGIPEPAGTPELDCRRLDVVLVPLVACDRRGNRLGMGGGFYDTTFAWHPGEEPGRPHLVGMAHDFQVVEALDPMPWDVPLGHIATPGGLITC